MAEFRFKHFKVQHDSSTMKVGTDAVLLGAWIDLKSGDKVLDVGCGCGVIGLMLAQRFDVEILGVDVDEGSVEETKQNIIKSPFGGKMSASLSDVRDLPGEHIFDCIVSNPPFFTESILPPDERRAAARNTQSLPFKDLLFHADRLLKKDGSLQLIIPSWECDSFLSEAAEKGFFLRRKMDVRNKKNKIVKRCLLHLSKKSSLLSPLCEVLTLLDDNGRRSEEYEFLTKDFYL